MASGKLQSVQTLRAVAALYVVLLHSYVYLSSRLPVEAAASGIGYVALAGNFGVDLFFVISGFVMLHNLYDDFGRLSPMAFLKRRAERIVPLYWLLTALVAVALVIVPGLFHGHPGLTAAWLGESFLFVPVTHARPIVVFGWTLNFEVYFYLVFGLALLLPRHWALASIAALFATSSLFGILYAQTIPWLALATNCLLLEFLAGMLVALSWRRLGDRHRALHISGLALGLAAFLWTMTEGRRSDPGLRLLEWGVPGALVLNGALRLERLRFPKLLVRLGDASYSLYLIQVVTMPVAAVGASLAGNAPFWALNAAAVLFSATCGWLCWRIVERPIGRWLRPRAGADSGGVGKGGESWSPISMWVASRGASLFQRRRRSDY